jgi:3-deoxy-7-phosphoheptulonate synthase
MIEVHENPEAALSDSPQSLHLEEFRSLMDQLSKLAPALGRKLARPAA